MQETNKSKRFENFSKALAMPLLVYFIQRVNYTQKGSRVKEFFI
jgi:hypothetical protein